MRRMVYIRACETIVQVYLGLLELLCWEMDVSIRSNCMVILGDFIVRASSIYLNLRLLCHKCEQSM